MKPSVCGGEVGDVVVVTDEFVDDSGQDDGTMGRSLSVTSSTTQFDAKAWLISNVPFDWSSFTISFGATLIYFHVRI